MMRHRHIRLSYLAGKHAILQQSSHGQLTKSCKLSIFLTANKGSSQQAVLFNFIEGSIIILLTKIPFVWLLPVTK
jgi:hypothetical protein